MKRFSFLLVVEMGFLLLNIVYLFSEFSMQMLIVPNWFANTNRKPNTVAKLALSLVVVSSNPGTAYWIDIFSQIITVKIDLFLWKDKNNSKRGPFKKQLWL